MEHNEHSTEQIGYSHQLIKIRCLVSFNSLFRCLKHTGKFDRAYECQTIRFTEETGLRIKNALIC